MNAITLTVLALLAIANAVPVTRQTSRLPMPEALQEKWGYLMKDDPPEVLSRIVGGSTVSSGGRPYQIALFRSGSFTCGGSLISSRTVLTAAHCVDGVSASVLTVRYNSLTYSSGGTTATVSAVNRHASYSSSTIDYDIATLTLTSAFSPGTNAAVATLATSGSDPASAASVIVSGWGRISSGGALSSSLLQATLAVVSRTDCSSRWGSTNSITARMFCAHSTTQSACNGDSGGPITQSGTQVGVVSWGSSSCLHATLPNVYASVGNLRTWINSNTIS